MPNVDELDIGLEIDTSALQSGIKSAQEAVVQASQNMAEAQKAFGAAAAAGSQQAIEALADYESALASAQAQLAAFEATQKSASAAVTSTSRAFMTSRDSAMLLGRELGGGLGYQLGRIASQSSALGGILTAAFPVVAAGALADVLTRSVTELYDLISNARQAGEELARAWDRANEKIEMGNDQLALSNSRLQDEIDKFQGKPSNGLQTALEEGIVAADRLQTALEGDTTALEALLKKHAVGFWGGLFGGVSPTTSVDKGLLQASQEVSDKGATILETFRANMLAAAGDKGKIAATQKQSFDDLNAVFDQEQQRLQKRLDTALAKQRQNNDVVKRLGVEAAQANQLNPAGLGAGATLIGAGAVDYSPQVNQLQRALAQIKGVRTRDALILQDESLEQQKGTLTQHKDLAEEAKQRATAARGAARAAAEAQMQGFNEGFAALKNAHQLSTEQEIAYWESLEKVAGTGSANYAKIVEKLGTLHQQLGREQQEFNQTGAEITSPDAQRIGPSEAATDYTKSIQDASKANAEWAQSLAQAHQIQLDTENGLAEASIRSEQLSGKLTALGAAHATAALHAKEYNEQLEILQQKLAAIEQTPMSPEERRKQTQGVNNGIAQLNGGQQVQQVQDQAKMLADFEAPYKKFFNTIDSSFQGSLDQWLQGTRTFGQAMGQTFDHLGVDFSNALLKMGLQALRWETETLISHIATNQKKVASDHSTATQSSAIQGTLAIKQIGADAAKAASATYAAVAEIPLVGPYLAPEAAAAAFAAVMAFQSLGSFDVGTSFVPKTGVAVIHRGERIIPAADNQRITAALVSPQSGQASGGPHFHYAPQISAMDGASVEGVMRTHSRTMMREMGRQLRRMNLVQ